MDVKPDRTVLIVEDSAFQRKMLSVVCAEAGFQTIQAENGELALELIANRSFNLIITDLEMPVMDGLQMLRKLGEQGDVPPLILISGHDDTIMSAAREMGEEFGLTIKGSITKPYIPEDFLDLLKSIELVDPDIVTIPTLSDVLYELPFTAIVDGIKNGAIEAFYQPQVCCKSKRLMGLECLSRWKISEGNYLGPNAFIPIAEKRGLMQLVTHTILEAALKDLAYWNKKGRELPISVNVSTDNLKDLHFPETLEALTQKYNVKPSSVVLEVTESKVMEEAKACLEVMARIRMMGFGLAIDDFGTGYASLKQLQHYPFTEMKLDKSYVAAAVSKNRSRSVLKSSIDLAKNLSLTCIAEGVETKQQADLLEELGCTHHQGFFYAQPMAAGEVLPWIQSLFQQDEENRFRKGIFAVSTAEEGAQKMDLSSTSSTNVH